VFLLPETMPKPSLRHKTANLRRRLQRLLGPVEERTKKLNLRESVRWIEYVPTGSDFESGVVLYKVLRSTFPKTYANRLRFRFAPLVKLNLENQYPRASITTRLGRLNGRNLYYGHSLPTAAEKFMNDSLDFFRCGAAWMICIPILAFPAASIPNEDVAWRRASRVAPTRSITPK